MELSLSGADLATFGLLTLSIGALWLPGARGVRAPWAVLLAAAAASGLFTGVLDWRAVTALAALGLAAHWLYDPTSSRRVRLASGAVVLALAAGLSLHLLPGFANPKPLADVVLSPGAVPYSKHLNFDKTAVGILLLAFGVQRIRGLGEWRSMLAGAAPVLLATLGAALGLSYWLGYVRFEPSLPPFFMFWAWTNLFFTCVAEEALFRGLVQGGLGRFVGLGRALSLFVAASLFGLAHYAGGWRYVLLAGVAGLGYGLAMQRTGRIEAAILTHFALNATHFAFFTYPALAAALG